MCWYRSNHTRPCISGGAACCPPWRRWTWTWRRGGPPAGGPGGRRFHDFRGRAAHRVPLLPTRFPWRAAPAAPPAGPQPHAAALAVHIPGLDHHIRRVRAPPATRRARRARADSARHRPARSAMYPRSNPKMLYPTRISISNSATTAAKPPSSAASVEHAQLHAVHRVGVPQAQHQREHSIRPVPLQRDPNLDDAVPRARGPREGAVVTVHSISKEPKRSGARSLQSGCGASWDMDTPYSAAQPETHRAGGGGGTMAA